MERVVYILGAGFSQPLGIPTVPSFLFSAKEQYFSEPESFSHFRDVFAGIDKMARAKSYISLDLFNIEEILSVLEMSEHTQGDKFGDLFQQFVKDVVEHHTPKLLLSDEPFQPQEWMGTLLGKSPLWIKYFAFVCNMLKLHIKQREISLTKKKIVCQDLEYTFLLDQEIVYSVITLNYDRIIESCLSIISSHFQIPFVNGRIPLAKLHGSVDSEIVPPTWRKLLPESVRSAWSDACQWISEANQIRILGYSLPAIDMYVKYLLTAGIIKSQNIKKIDVICLDPSGEVKARFDSLITFPRYRFASGDLSLYLESCAGVGYSSPPFQTTLGRIESVHEYFMEHYIR